MQSIPDHYRVLQVHHEAGQEVIEAAYKRLCRIYHPDVNGDPGAGARMQEINAAYEVLGDKARRGAYHRQWAAVSPRAPRREPSQQASAQKGDAWLAQEALEGYFRCLMDGQWDGAYARLTFADRRNVPARDFREWKEAVAGSYTIGSFVVKPFRRYQNCVVSGVTYREVYEFSVIVCDMFARTGRIGEENCLKYVAMDAGSWRVCLGYADVKPLILRFKYMAENAAALDPAQVYADAVMNRDRQTGLCSRRGFEERAEAEAVRSRRYGNPFTVALIIVRSGAESTAFSDREYAGMCVVHAARAVLSGIRQTDIVGRWGDAELAVLFTETPRAKAALAMDKMLKKIRRTGELRYDVVFGLSEFDGGHLEDTMAAAASDAQVRKHTDGGVTKTYVTVNGYS